VYAEARAHPRDGAAAGRLAMMLHAYEQYALAAVYYRRAVQVEPDTAAWTYLAGLVDAELGRTGAAVARLRRAIALDGTYLPARLRLADVLLNAGNLQESRLEFESILRDYPELAVARYGLGRVLTALGDRPAATAEYERAVASAPQFGPAAYALALAYRDAGMNDRAAAQLEVYRRSARSRPAVPDPWLDEVRSLAGTARTLIAQGARAAREGRLDEAIALHLKAIAADPADPQAHVNLISLYGRSGRADDAEQHYQAALRLQGSLAEAHYNYGVLRASQGRYDEAADAFRRALDADPFHARAHNNLGALLARQGHGDRAAAHFRQALASDPAHAGARFALGGLLLAAGKAREALEQFQRLPVDGDSEAPRYRMAAARAWFALGEVQKALEVAEAARRDAEARQQLELAAAIAVEIRRFEAARR
jgi:tetratricopeptide (TPR) repeat protein